MLSRGSSEGPSRSDLLGRRFFPPSAHHIDDKPRRRIEVRRSGVRLGRAAVFVTCLASVPAAAANLAPIANAGPDRTGTRNIALTLSGAGSVDPDGTIAAYWWQF